MVFDRRIAAWRVLLFVLATAGTACSLLIDTDQLHETGGAPSGIDAGTDAGASDAAVDAGEHDALTPDGRRAYRDAVLADDPIAYYRLNETSGTAALDETGHGHTGTYVGVTQGVAGALLSDPDPAVSMAKGTQSHVTVGDRLAVFLRAPFSVEVWIKPTELDETYRFPFSNEQLSPRNGYALVIHTQYGITFERYVDDGQAVTQGAPIAVGVYHHVVGTYDGASLRLYLNGIYMTEKEDVRDMPVYTPAAAIGILLDGMRGPFDGAIDEVAIYSSALTPARVKAHFDAAKRP